MKILSTRVQPRPCPQIAPEREHNEGGHSAFGSATHAAIEATDAFLHTTHHLESFSPQLGSGLRAGVGALALARGGKALLRDHGIQAKLEGMASVGLGVASAASLLHGNMAHHISTVGQSVRGLSETALGAYQILGKDHAGERHEIREIAKGVLNCAKGVTTFLPMIAHHTAKGVGLLHLGIIGANLALELSQHE